MPVSKCPSLHKSTLTSDTPLGTNISLREPIVGTPAFPIAAYDDNVEADSVIWHWHEEFEIGCITEGNVLIEIGNLKYTLGKGDMFFINSGIIHAMRNSVPGKPAVFKALVFHGSIIGGKENSIFHQKYLLPILKNVNLRGYIFKKDDAHTNHLFSSMLNLWLSVCNEEIGYELQVRNELSNFFYLMITCTDFKTTFISDDEQRIESRIKAMLDYIHCCYFEAVTLENISNAASISVSEALRCFKNTIGISPIQYLKNYRLQQAANYIKSGAYSIRKVCDLCGFSDSSYFSKSFKEVYHCTPREYSRQ